MNTTIKTIIDEARAWADEQYQLKGGQPGTDLYFQNKHRAMIELLVHLENKIEENNNG